MMKILGKRTLQLIFINKDSKTKQSKHQELISTSFIINIINKINSFRL
jgi:hypothetical protein